ncbi:MAG: hypothetical protein R3A78_01870 [Polyangiales bacterium]
MRLLDHCRTLLLALAVVLALPFSASAQGWLDGRQRAEGPGFRLGDLELHPGVGAEIGYDTNVFLSSDKAGVDPRRTSPILRLTPHIYLSTLGPERSDGGGENGPMPIVDFRTGVSASLYHYLQTEARSNVEMDVDTQLTFLPRRPVSFTLLGTFMRTIRPFTESGAVGQNYNRDQITGGGKLTLQTRGGILKSNVGYTFGADLFEGGSFKFGNGVSHKVALDAAWRFLPSTALLYDGEVNFHNYTSNDPGTVLISDNTRVRTRFGFNGYITRVISVLAMVGYGAGFYVAGDDYDSIVGQAQLAFAFSDAVNFSLGYDRDFFRTFVGNFYRRDRGSMRFQLLLGGVFLTGLEAGVGLYDFGQTFTPTGGTIGDSYDRSDVRADGSLFAEYRFTDWFAVNSRVEYMANFTDFRFNVATATPVFDPADYSRWTIWGGVRVFY